MSRVVRRINGGSRVDGRDAGRMDPLERSGQVSKNMCKSPSPGRCLWRAPYWGAEDWEVSEYALQHNFAPTLPEGLRGALSPGHNVTRI
jgi:hypothetical protein